MFKKKEIRVKVLEFTDQRSRIDNLVVVRKQDNILLSGECNISLSQEGLQTAEEMLEFLTRVVQDLKNVQKAGILPLRASEATGIVQHKTLAPHPAYADDIHIRTHKYGLYAEKEESGLA